MAMIALWACGRFSASSNATGYGPTSAPSAIPSPAGQHHSAGSGSAQQFGIHLVAGEDLTPLRPLRLLTHAHLDVGVNGVGGDHIERVVTTSSLTPVVAVSARAPAGISRANIRN